MLNRNQLSTGLLIGIIVPLIGFGIIYGLFQLLDAAGVMSDSGFSPRFRERTAALVAIALNAVALNRYQKMRFTETMRGIVVPTAVYVVIWLFVFRESIFGGF
jgi:hypothetical protein